MVPTPRQPLGVHCRSPARAPCALAAACAHSTRARADSLHKPHARARTHLLAAGVRAATGFARSLPSPLASPLALTSSARRLISSARPLAPPSGHPPPPAPDLLVRASRGCRVYPTVRLLQSFPLAFRWLIVRGFRCSWLREKRKETALGSACGETEWRDVCPRAAGAGPVPELRGLTCDGTGLHPDGPEHKVLPGTSARRRCPLWCCVVLPPVPWARPRCWLLQPSTPVACRTRSPSPDISVRGLLPSLAQAHTGLTRDLTPPSRLLGGTTSTGSTHNALWTWQAARVIDA